jgi:hypothetical protein
MTNNINEQKDEVPFENVASLEHLNRKKHDDNYQDRKKRFMWLNVLDVTNTKIV